SVLLLLFMGWVAIPKETLAQDREPIDYVNVLMRTLSKYELSHGNTYPVLARPWGMNFWTPQTGKMGDGWIYQYTADKINGFKQTHQPSPWNNDYGQFALMPVTGTPEFNIERRASWFSHKAEVAAPNYYSVYLADYDITTELTPTSRAAVFRFTFPKTDSAYVILDAFDKGSYVKVIPEENKIVGYTTKNSGGVPDNFKNYFVIVFDRPFANYQTIANGEISSEEEQKEDHVGAIIGFHTSKGEKVQAKVASSFISFDQAELNLKEVVSSDFEKVKEEGRKEWNDILGRVEIMDEDIDKVRTFYSALYRS